MEIKFALPRNITQSEGASSDKFVKFGRNSGRNTLTFGSEAQIELGDSILSLLADDRTEDTVLPNSSIWIKRMDEGFVNLCQMAPAQAASAFGTIGAWRGTVLNHENPILETEVPANGAGAGKQIAEICRNL